jgi:predicted DNA-binding transcriptional regulator YafY
MDGQMSLSRLDDFVQLFQEQRCWKVRDIQQRLRVSRQSVYRLRDQLYSRRQIALEANIRDDDGTLMLSERASVGCLCWPEGLSIEEDVSFSLSQTELEALKTAVAQMQHLTPLLDGVLSKLSSRAVIQRQLQAEPIIFNPQVDYYEKDLFAKVSKAIKDRRVGLLSYQNAQGETKSYKFNSYILIPSDQHLHLIGVSHNSLEAGFNTVIRLRFDQIRSFKLLTERFHVPDFDVAEYATREFGPFSCGGEPVTIRVVFSAEKAHYITRTRRHKTQRVSKQPDGSVIWTIDAPLSEDLIYWIVSYGPHAQVLTPPELKAKVVAWAKGALDANS